MSKNLLRQLPVHGILAGLFLVFTVPFGIVANRLIAEIDGSIRFIVRERAGVSCNNTLRQLLERLIQHQQLTNQYLQDDSPTKALRNFSAETLRERDLYDRIQTQQAEVEAAIQAMDEVDRKLGGKLKTTQTWQELKQDWQGLQQRWLLLSPKVSVQLHQDLINEVLSLMTQVGDASNLILASDLDSYYLMDIIVNHLPAMLQASAQARDFGTAVMKRRTSLSVDDKVQLVVLSKAIESPLKSIQRGLEVAFQENPDLRPKLDTHLQSTVRHSQALLQQLQPTTAQTTAQTKTQPQTEKQGELSAAGNQAIAFQTRLYNVTVPALEQLLQVRLDRLIQRKQQIRLFSVFVLVTLVAIFLFLARSLRQRKRAEQRLTLQYATASVLAEAIVIDQATFRILQTIGKALNCDYAEYWSFNPKNQRMDFAKHWSNPAVDTSQFVAVSRKLTFEPGVGLIGQVWSNRKAVWIADVIKDVHFLRTQEAANSGFHAVFCFPILHVERVLGVMAFFSRRVQSSDAELLKMISTIGNQIGQFIQRKHTEEVLQCIAQGIFTSAGDAFFASLVQQLATTLDVNVALIGKLTGKERTLVSTIAVSADGRIGDNFEYALQHSPCADVLGQGVCCYLQDTQKQFPLDPLLQEMGIESYMGVPLFSSAGQALGLLVVMSKGAIADPLLAEFLLKIFATRAAAEIERQQAETTLREQEALLRMALSAARMGAWDWNILSGEEKWSKEVAEIFGFPSDSRHVTYLEFFQRIHPEDRTLVHEAQNRTLQDGVEYNAEYRIFWEDGSLHWVNSRGNVVRDAAGKPLLLTGVTIDITQRKQAEAALRQAEAKYRSIFENAIDGIFQTTPDGIYISANSALASIYGYDSPEQLMSSFSNNINQHYVDPNRRSEFIQLIELHGSVSDFESQVYRRDGSTTWISENARAVFDQDGNLLYYEGIVKDICDRKEAAEELFTAKEVAESANLAKSQFLANMSHELRTPLNAIIGYSEMLQEDAGDLGHTELSSDLKKIHSAGKHLLNLINDILDISKIEAGKMDLYLETFRVPALIAEVQATIQPLVEKNANTLQVHCPQDLGSMHADLTKVRQILFNLISNAAKFTHNGTIGLTVERLPEDREMLRGADHTQMQCSPPFLRFTVSDTGIGIPLEQLEHLFQPFSQADPSTTRKYGGTGLGLAISRRFCQMMGGDIYVTSELGVGSTFSICLPVQVQEQNAEPVSSRISLDENRTFSAPLDTGAIVLVIDDDPSVRDLMARQLGKEGFQVETAANGQEGLHLARKLHPHAITLDVMMPKMDGWSVLGALKADPKLADIPVILLSMIDEKNLGFALSASDYLTKPIDYKRLTRILDKYRPQSRLETAPVGHSLIVEDDPEIREMFRRILENKGWTVAEAENGRIALEHIASQSPALILLDLMMPEMDGFQFLARFRSHPSYCQIPIIVITAMDLTPAERLQLNGGVERVLQKGAYSRDALLQEIRDLVVSLMD